MSAERDAALKELESARAEGREAALDRLGMLKPADALDLLAAALADPNTGVRGTAACNLGLIRDGRAIPLLIRAVADDPSEEVRAEALASLTEYDGPEVLACLLAEVHRPKRSRRPRQEVAKQLRKYRSAEAVIALRTLLHDDDVFVREHAGEALAQLLESPELRLAGEEVLKGQAAETRPGGNGAVRAPGELSDTDLDRETHG